MEEKRVEEYLIMEKLTNNMASKIAKELELDNDNRDIIAYGMFALISIALSIISIIIFGMIFHVAIEALIICFTGSILRKYSGGVHASSPSRCIIIGTIVCIGQAIIFSLLIGPVITKSLVIILGIVVFVMSYYFLYKLAPVDSIAKPIKKREKIIRMKKRSIFVLSIYLIIVIINIFMHEYSQKKGSLIYSLCIYGGVTWQVFTLTKMGNNIMNKIDSFFSQIARFIKGVK